MAALAPRVQMEHQAVEEMEALDKLLQYLELHLHLLMLAVAVAVVTHQQTLGRQVLEEAAVEEMEGGELVQILIPEPQVE